MVLVAAEQGLEVEASLKQRTEKNLTAIKITQNNRIFGMCTHSRLARDFVVANVVHLLNF